MAAPPQGESGSRPFPRSLTDNCIDPPMSRLLAAPLPPASHSFTFFGHQLTSDVSQILEAAANSEYPLRADTFTADTLNTSNDLPENLSEKSNQNLQQLMELLGSMVEGGAGSQTLAGIPGDLPAISLALFRPSLDPRKYKTQLCRNWNRTGACAFGDACVYAHGAHELRRWGQNVSVMSVLQQLAAQLKMKLSTDPNQPPSAAAAIGPAATPLMPSASPADDTEDEVDDPEAEEKVERLLKRVESLETELALLKRLIILLNPNGV